MRTTTLHLRGIAVAGLAAVLLTACGGSGDSDRAAGAGGSSSASTSAQSGLAGKTGPEVAAAAADALAGVDAVHVTGTGTEAGQQVTLDLQLQGSDLSGTIATAGQTVQIISTGGQTYAQAPAAFWSSQGIPAEAAGQLDGRWVALPAEVGDELSGFSLADLADELRHPSDGEVQQEVTTGQVDGQDVVVVTQADGSALSVAATGTPYPLQIDNKGDEASSLTLRDFGKKQTIAAPPSPLDFTAGA
ncbi:hypothetical protein [Modestobacter sp. NPDC049651]|uniref:hypothetical protein n=1 Tax=unclassified Modestobacter TaxID=2643866 RepID=UPI0033C51A25